MTNTISLDDLDQSAFDQIQSDDMAVPQILDKNWQTTAAVGLTVASGGVLGCLSLAAFPAQTLVAGTGIGVLAYAGKRRADGKTPLPFVDQIGKKDSKKSVKKSKKAESKTETKQEEEATASSDA